MKSVIFSLAISLISMCPTMGEPQKPGGSSFILRIQERKGDDGNNIPITKQQVDQAIVVIEKRLNRMGTTGRDITRQGTDGIMVQISDASPEKVTRIRATLEKTAMLELREVSLRSDEAGPGGKTLAQRVLDGDEIVPGFRSFTLKGKDEKGNEYARSILLKRRRALSSLDIAKAEPTPGQTDAVSITLNGDGIAKMIDLTKNMRPGMSRIAILLDGEVISAPVLNQVPLGKHFIIEGLHGPNEAQDLANTLMTPLENSLKIEEVHTVAPK